MTTIRIDRELWLMRMAEVTSLRGTCSRLNVGAIIARDNRVVSTGYNGAPAGLHHCQHFDATPGCPRSVHAEANAIAYAARKGVATEGAEIYVTHQPCIDCAKLVINAGLLAVTWANSYRLQDGVNLLKEAGIQLFQFVPTHTGVPSRIPWSTVESYEG